MLIRSVHQKHKEIFDRFKEEMEKLFSKRPDYPRLHGTRNRTALKMLHFRQRFQKMRFHLLLFYRSRINGRRKRIEKDQCIYKWNRLRINGDKVETVYRMGRLRSIVRPTMFKN